MKPPWFQFIALGVLVALAVSLIGAAFLDRERGALLGAGVGLLLVIGLGVGWGILDAMRPPTECPNCKYDLAGLPKKNGLRRCPECGCSMR